LSRPDRGASRRQARRAALVLLYQAQLTERDMDVLIERYEADTRTPLPAYARSLIQDVTRTASELDATIGAHARGWTIDRISPVERSAMRIAIAELDGDDVPAAVAIAESVALVKRYASPEAATFVNGVLGAVARERGVGR
jgi:transcription antitermination protein NusB